MNTHFFKLLPNYNECVHIMEDSKFFFIYDYPLILISLDKTIGESLDAASKWNDLDPFITFTKFFAKATPEDKDPLFISS